MNGSSLAGEYRRLGIRSGSGGGHGTSGSTYIRREVLGRQVRAFGTFKTIGLEMNTSSICGSTGKRPQPEKKAATHRLPYILVQANVVRELLL